MAGNAGARPKDLPSLNKPCSAGGGSSSSSASAKSTATDPLPGAIPLRAPNLRRPQIRALPRRHPPPRVYSMASCGLSPAAAAATSKVRTRSTGKPDAVHALLRSYGFSAADIARVARSTPLIFNADPEQTIRPKLDFFVSLGLTPRLLACSPTTLGLSLDKHLVPCIQFLRGVIGADEGLRRAISRYPRAINVSLEKRMRPAVEALHHHGLTQKAISKLLVVELSVLQMSPARIGEVFQELKELGLCITDTRFLYCFRTMGCISREKWLQKLSVYQSFGVSKSEVLQAFKKHANIVSYADKTIHKKLRFLLDELKLQASDVMQRPVIIGYSLERTIMPRCAVLNVLMREGKIGRDIKWLTALLGSSSDFLAKYVLRYVEDVPDVVNAYDGKIKFEGLSGLRV